MKDSEDSDDLKDPREPERTCGQYSATSCVRTYIVVYYLCYLSNTHMKQFLRFLGVVSMSTGVALTIMNGITYTQADLSGGGVTLHPAASSIVMQSIPPNQVTSAYEHASTADELAIGILLILLGLSSRPSFAQGVVED